MIVSLSIINFKLVRFCPIFIINYNLCTVFYHVSYISKDIMKSKRKIRLSFFISIIFLVFFTVISSFIFIISLKPVKKINKEKKYRAFISARIGKIRLIDNIEL